MNFTQPYQVIKALEETNSRLEKEQILLDASKEPFAEEFFLGFRIALNPYIQTNIKKIKPGHMEDGPGLIFRAFDELVQKLHNREITGNVAAAEVDSARLKCTQDQWDYWYRRILLKNMKCGTSTATFNKIAKKVNPDWVVPGFGVQLAVDSAGEIPTSGLWQVEIKLDGVRALTIVENGVASMFSRNGKPLDNFPHIALQIQNEVNRIFGCDMVLDGEVMSDSFQDLMKQLHRKSDVKTTDATLYLFDMMTLEEFKADSIRQNQLERSQSLAEFIENADMPNVRHVDFEVLDMGTPEGQARYLEINNAAIEGGYEGVMLKDVTAKYERKRTKAWQKAKPFIEVTLEAVDVEVGTGKNSARMGNLICEGEVDGVIVRVSVGSGFRDYDRDKIWAVKHAVIGHLVEVRADAVTKNQNGTYSLRFPRFKTFRGFEAGEQL